ncbi:MAG: hypothetical protein J0I06_04605 [Planctomycetes bacterium]|nr:hypothetical protein [Planctomycetota bacterium]
MIPFRTGAGFGLALLVASLAGCTPAADGRAVVRGKLLDNGKPFALDTTKLKLPPGATGLPPGSRPLSLTFLAEGGEQFPANVTDAGTFEVVGPDGKGIKPGRYKVAITAGAGGPDYFGGKFAPDKTQIVREVKPGEEVVIDVAKP